MPVRFTYLSYDGPMQQTIFEFISVFDFGRVQSGILPVCRVQFCATGLKKKKKKQLTRVVAGKMRISRYVFLSSSEGQDDQSRHLPSDCKVRFSPASTASRCPIAATANPSLSTPLPPSPLQHLPCM